MVPTPLQRLADLGYGLPEAPVPQFSYVPTARVPISSDRALLFIAGQISARDGVLMTGRVPDTCSPEQAQEAARASALNILAQIEAECGLDKVIAVAQVTGYVNSSPEFDAHPTVINAASDLIVGVFGEIGRHTRVALGVAALPRGVTVEISAIVVVRP